MQLIYVVLALASCREIRVVNENYPFASGFELDKKARTWTNGCKHFGKPMKIGQPDYEPMYQDNTVIAVLNLDDGNHLNTLANLRYDIEMIYKQRREPGREASH